MKKQGSKVATMLDQHLMMVGKLVNNAAVCDAILFSAFKILTGCAERVASAIYFSSESLSAKKSVITRILNALDDPAETEIVNRIIAGANVAHTQRNELSHALLRASPDGEKLLSHNPRRQTQAQKPVTVPYLDSLLKNSTQAYLDTYRAFQELCRKRGIPPSVTLE